MQIFNDLMTTTSRTGDRLTSLQKRVENVHKDLPKLENHLLKTSSAALCLNSRLIFNLEPKEGYNHFSFLSFLSLYLRKMNHRISIFDKGNERSCNKRCLWGCTSSSSTRGDFLFFFHSSNCQTPNHLFIVFLNLSFAAFGPLFTRRRKMFGTIYSS